MPLKVVGTGLGRTGTKSMQTALNMLGFGPCHHMVEVFTHPESMALWIDAGEGRPDWDLIFKDYQSMVDYPGAAYWRQIADHYPGRQGAAHRARPGQVVRLDPGDHLLAGKPGGERSGSRRPLSSRASWVRCASTLHDRAWMTDYFRQHTEEVKAAIPPERLLIYEVGEGWDRLCKFLGVPVPAEPYPSENSREEFIARSSAMRAAMAQQPGEQA